MERSIAVLLCQLCARAKFQRGFERSSARNMSAKTTAEAFFNNFVVHYGLPKGTHSDQGATFESKLLEELCSLTGIAKSRTAPYHNMGNCQCEKFNRTLINVLDTLDGKLKSDWKSHIGPYVHADNCTKNDTTQGSTFYLMFGRRPRSPIDIAFGIDLEKRQPACKYVSNMKKRLEQAYKKAKECISSSQDKQKRFYDVKVRWTTTAHGDCKVKR